MRWREYVEEPHAGAHLPTPSLVTVPSPYRHVFNPLLDYILEANATSGSSDRCADPGAGRTAVVPPPAAQQARRDAEGASAGARREDVVVINVPWYLST